MSSLEEKRSGRREITSYYHVSLLLIFFFQSFCCNCLLWLANETMKGTPFPHPCESTSADWSALTPYSVYWSLAGMICWSSKQNRFFPLCTFREKWTIKMLVFLLLIIQYMATFEGFVNPWTAQIQALMQIHRKMYSQPFIIYKLLWEKTSSAGECTDVMWLYKPSVCISWWCQIF